ncbi:uncharacterized protein LOC136035226 isoform X2 [Artemia franciscana]|uniref:uncharacterized protein LOC136035226 isoform X2 n=1 Tax=Artemia franciscana TaxID=6661 RepID=UPI0032DAEEDE
MDTMAILLALHTFKLWLLLCNQFTVWEISKKGKRKLTHLDFEDKVCLHSTADVYYDHIISTSNRQAMALDKGTLPPTLQQFFSRTGSALFYDSLFTNVFGISNGTTAAEKMLDKLSETSTENIT